MLILTNTAPQTVQPGQAVVFDEVVEADGGCCKGISPSGTSVKLGGGRHMVHLNLNVGGAAGTQASLALALGGEAVPYTTMTETITAATDVFNSGGTFPLAQCCCDFDRLSVVNTGTTPVEVAARPMLAVKRCCGN